MTQPQSPKLSFGIIVFNGEPFIKHCILSLYQHAHEILISEGAEAVAAPFATAEGHSTDNTVAIIRQLQARDDPDNKIKLIQTDGFWENRDQQSRAYANVATGDYLWQVDADEFYHPKAIETVRAMLQANPLIDGASFHWLTFFASGDYLIKDWIHGSLRDEVNRLFRWGSGYRYARHWEGPTSIAPDGKDMTGGNWVKASDMARRGVLCHHYSLLFPAQVRFKTTVYATGIDPTHLHHKARLWLEHVWKQLDTPYRVHNRTDRIAWLIHFTRPHPTEVVRMLEFIAANPSSHELRQVNDIKRQLRRSGYRVTTLTLSCLGWLWLRSPIGKLRGWLEIFAANLADRGWLRSFQALFSKCRKIL